LSAEQATNLDPGAGLTVTLSCQDPGISLPGEREMTTRLSAAFGQPISVQQLGADQADRPGARAYSVRGQTDLPVESVRDAVIQLIESQSSAGTDSSEVHVLVETYERFTMSEGIARPRRNR
jgi:hypothetical protein